MGSSFYKPINRMKWDPFFFTTNNIPAGEPIFFTFQGLRFGLERVINLSPSALVLSGDSELFWVYGYDVRAWLYY